MTRIDKFIKAIWHSWRSLIPAVNRRGHLTTKFNRAAVSVSARKCAMQASTMRSSAAYWAWSHKWYDQKVRCSARSDSTDGMNFFCQSAWDAFLINDSRDFFAISKRIVPKNKDLPSTLIMEEGHQVEDPQEIIEAFQKYFSQQQDGVWIEHADSASEELTAQGCFVDR